MVNEVLKRLEALISSVPGNVAFFLTVCATTDGIVALSGAIFATFAGQRL
jgi:hypothetical protein